MLRFQQFNEIAYPGNIGIMELVKFHQIASKKQKEQMKHHIQNKNTEKMRDLIATVTGVKLHRSFAEEVKPDILPKAGAGQDGTDTLVKSYMRDTPGQNYKRFKQYIK